MFEDNNIWSCFFVEVVGWTVLFIDAGLSDSGWLRSVSFKVLWYRLNEVKK